MKPPFVAGIEVPEVHILSFTIVYWLMSTLKLQKIAYAS
jgi:hypothetical protein